MSPAWAILILLAGFALICFLAHWLGSDTGVCHRCGRVRRTVWMTRLRHTAHWVFGWCGLFLFALAGAGAIRVDGVDDRAAYINAVPAFNTTNQITLAGFYTKEAGMSVSGEFITKGRTFNGNRAGYHLRNNSGQWQFYFASPDATFHIYTTTASFADTNVIHHVAFTFTYGTAASAQFYVDGTRVAGSWTAGTGAVAGLTNAEPLHFGFGATLGWKGTMAEVCGWNTVLGDDEIKNLACSRVRGMPAQIRRDRQMFYYPMHAEFPPWTVASGTNTIRDLGPAAAHGTPLNSPQMRPSVLSEP